MIYMSSSSTVFYVQFLFPETSVLTDMCRVPEMYANLPMPLTSALYDRYHISPSTNFVYVLITSWDKYKQ